tara:strand:+ start:332 stop:565 length:234 start_codon:yes stop_codon:yes gene_type:complete
MSYLKSTKSSNKAKFPIKTSETPHGVCRHCNKPITSENRLSNASSCWKKKECKPCLRIKSRIANRRKSKILKENPLW